MSRTEGSGMIVDEDYVKNGKKWEGQGPMDHRLRARKISHVKWKFDPGRN